MDIFVDSVDFNFLFHASLRYSLGRRTTAPGHVKDIFCRHLEDLGDNTLKRIVTEIEEAESDNRLGDPTIDAPSWKYILKHAKELLEKRHAEANKNKSKQISGTTEFESR